MKPNLDKPTLAIATALFLGVPTVQAQDDEESREAAARATLEEIVVTARRREENLMDIPVAVTAIGAEEIENRQIYSVREVAAYSPGLNINSDSVGRAFVSIRGIGTTLIDTVQPGVGIFIDGVYQPNTSYLNSPLLDVKRVEVLRGPQGTLFGNNTLGGAINVITRPPSNEFRGEISGVYAGTDDFQSAAMTLSGPLAEDVLLARFGASYHSRDGFMENVLAGGQGNPLDQRSANLSLNWFPADTATFKLNTRYDEVEGGSTPYRNVAGPEDYQYSALSNLNSIATFTYKSVDLTGEFELGDSTLTATAAWYRRDSEGIADGDFGPIDFIRSTSDRRLETVTGELRLDTEWNDRVSTLFGLYANRTEDDASGTTTIVPLNLTAPSAGESEGKTLGIFANVFYQLHDSTELSVGVRYDDQELDASNSGADEAYTASELQPRVTLTRFWRPEFMTYASIARGFRGGGQNGPGAPNLIYQGDSVWTYEIGSKAQLLDGRLGLNLAAFYNDYEHFIGQNALAPNQDAPGSFVSVDLNTGDVKSYGLEVEADWSISERWSLDGTLTLLHARITDPTEFEQTTGFSLPSDRIIFTPDWNYHVGSTYWLPIGDDELVFSASVVGKGERLGSTLSETFAPELEAYHLVDTYVAWRRDRFELAVFAKNLFDEEYFESYIDRSLLERAGVPPFIVSNLGIPGDKRRYGVRATYEF